MIFLMVGVIERRAILRQYIVAALRPDRDAWAGPKPGYNNQALRQGRIGFLENLYMVVVDALERDNIWRLEFLWR